jgi:hypothetical protein
MLKEIFSLLYDVLALNMFLSTYHCALKFQIAIALVSGGLEGTNPRQVFWNFFLI